jgi:hypothetical protein
MPRLYTISLLILLHQVLCSQVYQGLCVPDNLGRFGNSSVITQASGLALDPNGTSLWTHNDQGNPTTAVYKFIPSTGSQAVTLEKTVNILNVTNLDWEDLAQDDSGHIYLCQIGKNCNANSDSLECPSRFVFKVHKLSITSLNHPDSADVTPATYFFKYPLTGYETNNCQPDDTVFVNSEAAIWYEGAIYLFSKNIWSKTTNNCGGWQTGYTYLFKVNLSEGSSMQNPLVAEYKGKVNLKLSPSETAAKYQVTSAAISPDDSTLALTTYGRVWLFRHFTGDAFFDGTALYVDFSTNGSDTITRGYEGIEFKNNRYLNLCVDGINGRVSGINVDNISLLIKHDGNTGPGSLRHAAWCADTGDTLQFAAALIQDTIHLTSGPVEFGSDVSIFQQADMHVFIKGHTSNVFNIQAGHEIHLKNIRIICGDIPDSGIINYGDLYLKDVEFHGNTITDRFLINYGSLQILGNCRLGGN